MQCVGLAVIVTHAAPTLYLQEAHTQGHWHRTAVAAAATH